jgi:hypothetical protein
MSWISKAEWQAAEPDPLASSAAGIIPHMNSDHVDAMVLYCKAFSKATEVTSASMTGVDRYGFEMSAMTAQGPRPVRLAFAKPVVTPEEARAALISMVKDARSKSGLKAAGEALRGPEDILTSSLSLRRRRERFALACARQPRPPETGRVLNTSLQPGLREDRADCEEAQSP